MWDRIEGDWNQFRHRVRHEWAKLSDEHLDEIDGRRDRLSRRVRDVYGVSDEEAEKQVSAWESDLRGAHVEPAPRLDSDPNAYPPSSHAQATWNGTNAAAETRNESREPDAGERRDIARPGPRTGTPREGTGGVFENEGPEFGENDRPGGAGMPGNQGGGRDPGPVGPSQTATSRDSGASSGARSPGNVSAGGDPSPPGTAGRGSA